MNRQEFDAVRDNISAQVRSRCLRYGLYGNVVLYEPSPIENSDRNRPYIIAGPNPSFSQDSPSAYLEPDKLLRQLERNEDLFYPGFYVYDLSQAKDPIQPLQDLVAYCKKAEVLYKLYGDYGLTPPERLRCSEVNQLIHYTEALYNNLSGKAVQKKARKDLDWFFKREKSKGLRKKWLEYFRSSRFPIDKGPIARITGFFQRGSNRLSVKQMMDGSNEMRKIEMQEFEFKLFEKFIKDCYPDVHYSVGEKTIVDHGLSRRPNNEFEEIFRRVTAEEYAVIRKEKFATEGWEALAGLTPAYWEIRDVYYKAADEPLVAAAYNSIVLQYAKCNDLSSLQSRGELCLQKVPASDFMNFVSLAKANNLRFYIDNLGDFAVPSFETINVLYNKRQEETLLDIVTRMIEDNAEYSHVLSSSQHPTLHSRMEHIEKSRNPSQISHPQKTNRINPPSI